MQMSWYGIMFFDVKKNCQQKINGKSEIIADCPFQ